MELILIRHPAPLVPPASCYGGSDVDVDPAMLLQAYAALAGVLPTAAPVYSSPLRRCVALASMLGAPITQDKRLREMHFGDWELRAWDDIPRAEIDAWAEDLLHYRPGGGECVLDVAARVQAFLRDVQRQPQPQSIVVCHAGSIRLIRALVGGAPLEIAAQQAAATPHKIAYGEVLRLPLPAKPV